MPGTAVARFATVGEAECGKSALQAARIDGWVLDGAIVSVNWLYSNAVGGVKLVVAKTDLEDAAAVLFSQAVDAGDGEVESASADAGEQNAPEQTFCPACGRSSFTRIPRRRLFAILALLFFGFGVAVGESALALAAVLAVALAIGLTPSHRCTSCGDRWTPREQDDIPTVAHPPDLADTVEDRCPRCGSAEVHTIFYRRVKALLLLPFVMFLALPLVLLVLVLPRVRCETCGLQRWTRNSRPLGALTPP